MFKVFRMVLATMFIVSLIFYATYSKAVNLNKESLSALSNPLLKESFTEYYLLKNAIKERELTKTQVVNVPQEVVIIDQNNYPISQNVNSSVQRYSQPIVQNQQAYYFDPYDIYNSSQVGFNNWYQPYFYDPYDYLYSTDPFFQYGSPSFLGTLFSFLSPFNFGFSYSNSSCSGRGCNSCSRHLHHMHSGMGFGMHSGIGDMHSGQDRDFIADSVMSFPDTDSTYGSEVTKDLFPKHEPNFGNMHNIKSPFPNHKPVEEIVNQEVPIGIPEIKVEEPIVINLKPIIENHEVPPPPMVEEKVGSPEPKIYIAEPTSPTFIQGVEEIKSFTKNTPKNKKGNMILADLPSFNDDETFFDRPQREKTGKKKGNKRDF